MPQQIVIHDCLPDVRDDVQNYWERKMPRIERLLVHMPADQRSLRLAVRHVRNRHEIRAVLILPTGTLVAEGSGLGHREALDVVADTLVKEVRRHHKLIGHDYEYRRKGRRSQAYLQNAWEAAAGPGG